MDPPNQEIAFKEIFTILAIIFLIAGIINLVVIVPLYGVLVRVRANYVPKRLQLDTEAGERVSDAFNNSYVGMLKRVYNIEGWAGFYKGFWGHILTGIVSGMAAAGTTNIQSLKSTSLVFMIIRTTFWLIIAYPTVLIVYRSITTPYKLGTFRPRKNIRILFTQEERSRIWNIYKAPGLIAALLLRALLGVLFVVPLQIFFAFFDPTNNVVRTIVFVVGFVIAFLETWLSTPLEVVIAKLAIQRNGTEVESTETAERYSDGEEDVLRFRDEQEPYRGIVDCVQRIVDEEGWQALYRVWWLKLAANLIAWGCFVAILVLSDKMKA